MNAPARSTLIAAALLAVALATHAQTPATPDYVPTLTFDVATIRESAPVERSLRVGVLNPIHSSKFEATNFTGKSLLQLAYGFGTPISGGPDWLGDRYYNVQAKSDPATDEKLARLTDDQARAEKAHMLQVLLTERMALKSHLETRESSVYALVVGKNGSKLHEAKAAAAPADSDPAHPSATPSAASADVRASGGPQGLQFTVSNSTARAIAAMIVSQINAPVLDRTGLTGNYQFVLQFGRDWSAGNPESWPDLFTAVQEQLGLKLEPVKAAIPVLILDHIEPPSAN